MATKKTATKSATGKPFAKGADARRGKGLPGRSGRKPVDFLAKCHELADDLVLPEAQKILEAGHAHPDFRWASEYVSKYAKSAAPTRTVVEGDEKKPLTVVVRHE